MLLIIFMCIYIDSPFSHSQEKYMILFYKNICLPNMVQICNNGGSWSKLHDSSQSLLTNDDWTSWQNFTTVSIGEKWKWWIALSAADYQIVLLFVRQKKLHFFLGVTQMEMIIEI